MKRQIFLCTALAAGSILTCAQSPNPAASPDDSLAAVFAQHLKSISSKDDAPATDCGTSPLDKPEPALADCGTQAFRQHKPFFLGYQALYGKSVGFAYGLAGDSSGNIFAVNYSKKPFPAVADRDTQLMDENHIRVTACTKPVSLDTTRQGLLACIIPINQEESEKARHQTPMDTTLCKVLENPAAFNNKLVRLRGHFSGNFEYSTINGDNCRGSIWLGYGGGNGPPTLSMYVAGGARPGSKDADGKLILAAPVKLVRDAKLELFEKQAIAMAQADQDSYKTTGKYINHCVTATFTGRVDAVSDAVHQFRKTHSANEHPDNLGFGQMGLYKAQLILQSVDDDATMGVCSQ